MRDALLLLLILVLAVGWFSTYGPMELPEERGLGPGDDRAGESPLVVSGSGALTEDVVGSTPATPAETKAVETPGGGSAWEKMTVTVTEVERMDPFLIGCVVGGALVLAGVFASPAAAWLWDKIHKK